MAGFLEYFEQIAKGGCDFDSLDVGARDHNILDPQFAQAQDIVQHGAFFRRESRVAVMVFRQCGVQVLSQGRPRTGAQEWKYR